MGELQSLVEGGMMLNYAPVFMRKCSSESWSVMKNRRLGLGPVTPATLAHWPSCFLNRSREGNIIWRLPGWCQCSNCFHSRDTWVHSLSISLGCDWVTLAIAGEAATIICHRVVPAPRVYLLLLRMLGSFGHLWGDAEELTKERLIWTSSFCML